MNSQIAPQQNTMAFVDRVRAQIGKQSITEVADIIFIRTYLVRTIRFAKEPEHDLVNTYYRTAEHIFADRFVSADTLDVDLVTVIQACCAAFGLATQYGYLMTGSTNSCFGHSVMGVTLGLQNFVIDLGRNGLTIPKTLQVNDNLSFPHDDWGPWLVMLVGNSAWEAGMINLASKTETLQKYREHRKERGYAD